MNNESILFVFDTEQSSGKIQEMYVQSQKDFSCHHANTAAEAKKVLTEQDFSFVISTIELPDQSGLDFMQDVKNNHEGPARIIYAEELDNDILYKSVGYVHQYISSAEQVDQFINILKNSLSLKNILTDEKLHKKISGISNLPSPPETYNKLVAELQKEDVSIRNVAELIKNDVSITAKLLQVVNSAFFGLSTHIENPLHAVTLLGIDTVKSIVLSAGVFKKFKTTPIAEYSIESIYSNSLQVGSSARHLANAFGFISKQTDEALMAGMLHDIGKLVMLSYFPEEFKESIKISQDKNIPLYASEKEVMGITDAEIGAHLLSLWGLPHSILEAIAQHYNPGRIPVPITNISTVVHLSYAINFDIQHNVKDASHSALDQDYLNKLNLDTDIESLKNFCMSAVV